VRAAIESQYPGARRIDWPGMQSHTAPWDQAMDLLVALLIEGLSNAVLEATAASASLALAHAACGNRPGHRS